MVTCRFCRRESEDGAETCKSCGAILPKKVQQPPKAPMQPIMNPYYTQRPISAPVGQPGKALDTIKIIWDWLWRPAMAWLAIIGVDTFFDEIFKTPSIEQSSYSMWISFVMALIGVLPFIVSMIRRKTKQTSFYRSPLQNIVYGSLGIFFSLISVFSVSGEAPNWWSLLTALWFAGTIGLGIYQGIKKKRKK